MTKLDELLSIPDKLERMEALIGYARALNIDIIQAQNNQGGYSEEKLVLLIFDAENNIKHESTHTYHFLSATVILATVILTLIIIFPRVVASIYNADHSINPQPSKALRAYDQEGKPLIQDGQAVLFELMDGIYQEFDESGRVKYEYLYKQGALLRKTHYDERGRVVDVQTYEGPKAGTP